MNRWSLLLIAIAPGISACQPKCDCSAAGPQSVLPCPSGAVSGPVASAAPPLASLDAAPPLASATPVASGSAPSGGAFREPQRESVECGFIEFNEGGALRRITARCHLDGSVASGSFVEVIDPNTAKPRFIVQVGEESFSIVGTTVKLPGTVDVMRVAFLNTTTGEEWTSTSASLRVTEFGAVGKAVKGTFEAVMAARLNRPAVTLRGQFELPRSRDRHSP